MLNKSIIPVSLGFFSAEQQAAFITYISEYGKSYQTKEEFLFRLELF